MATLSAPPGVSSLIDAVRRDGFVVVRGFLPVDQVERAHAELEEAYRRDLEDRRARGVLSAQHDGVSGTSILSRPSHLLLNVYGRSPAFDRLVERILTDPLSAALLRAVAGERFRFRGYNLRRMTGEYDPPPAHEWHRDSPGAFNIGIFLTDVPGPGEAATALVAGSHHFPSDPRWETLISPPYRGVQWFLRHNPMSRRLARTALRGATGAYGRRGDFYVFVNDVWHGREPNLNGSQAMVALLGAFPTEFPFPDEPVPIAPEVLARLPPAVRRAATYDQPPNTSRDTVIHEMLRGRPRPRPTDWFYWARMERRVADAVSALARRGEPAVAGALRRARSGASSLASQPGAAARKAVYCVRLYPRLAARWVYRRTVKRFVAPGH